MLPGGSALHLRGTGKGGLPLALSVEAADLVELEDVLALCSHVKLAILEHEGGKVEHEPFGQPVLEGKPELEIYCHKEDRYFCFLQCQKLVDKSHEFLGGVEGVVEVGSRTGIPPHRNAAHVLSVLRQVHAFGFLLPGRKVLAGGFVRERGVKLEVLNLLHQQVPGNVEVVEGVSLVGESAGLAYRYLGISLSEIESITSISKLSSARRPGICEDISCF